jgi:hypothetical protein
VNSRDTTLSATKRETSLDSFDRRS